MDTVALTGPVREVSVFNHFGVLFILRLFDSVQKHVESLGKPEVVLSLTGAEVKESSKELGKNRKEIVEVRKSRLLADYKLLLGCSVNAT